MLARTASRRRPVQPLFHRICQVAAAMAGLAGASGVHAAADNVNAPPSTAASGAGLLAAGRRMLANVIESEQSVIAALRDNAADSSPSVAVGVTGAPLQRAGDIAARATAAARSATDPAQRASGLSDVSLGARWKVLQGDADSHVPCVSWMADVQPASAAALTGSSTLRPSVHLSAEWSLPENFSLGLMPGMAIDLDPQGRRVANGTLAVTLGKAWTPQWRTFVDMARDRLALVQAGAISTTLDAGVSFLASEATQIDVALTHGLTTAAPAFQAGLGVSSRF